MATPLQFEEQRLSVANALRHVERSLQRLAEGLAHERDIRVVTADEDALGPAIRRICEAYLAIDLGEDDVPGKSVVCLGVVGVSAALLGHAEQVNAAKAALREVCAPLQRIRTRVPDGAGTRALPVIRVILRSLQRSDLNLLAAYRKIPILAAMPTSVSYTRARTRAVYRKSVEAIAALLQNSDSPRAVADRARLAALPAGIGHLALVRDHYENVRANVVYDGFDPRGRRRVQVAAELPLLYAVRPAAALPTVTFPPPGGQQSEPVRKRRSKLEPRPFLEALPVYRYLPPSR